MRPRVPGTVWLALVLIACASARGGDWPQFMAEAGHSGDAAGEELALPLGLLARVALDDAVLSSPAVVAGRAYVVDQTGTAYCVDPDGGKVVWRAAPDGERAMGANTSSPAVHKGRVYFGTTAGAFHVLDAADGRVIRNVAVGAPVVSAPVVAHDRVYFQALDAVVRCLDLDGNEVWRWDHYARYVEPADIAKQEQPKRGHPGSYDKPHHGGRELAVSGRRIVTGIGWDLLCLDDKGDRAEVAWCRRAALGKDGGVPMSPAICDGYVYVGYPAPDGAGNLLRVSLADGSFDPKAKDVLGEQWAIVGTPAVRGRTAFWGRTHRGATAYEFGKGTLWSTFTWTRPANYTPIVSSPALTKDHCLFTTLGGELIAVAIASKGTELANFKPEPFRFRTAQGRPIGSSPAVSGGRVFFGCDDGFLYVLAPGGQADPKGPGPAVHERRSKVVPATDKTYAWPSPFGSPGNTNFIDDAALAPPLRMKLRWAVRSLAMFKSPMSASEQDLFFSSMAGTIACHEQATGRLRWRTRLPMQWQSSAGVLVGGDGRLYVGRPGPSIKSSEMTNQLFCLDEQTGAILWSAEIGRRGHAPRAAPVLIDGIVAFGAIAGEPPVPVVQAWHAATGQPAWTVTMEASASTTGPVGCSDGKRFYFSTGAGAWQYKDKPELRGQSVAIEPKTGRVAWKTSESFISGYGEPAWRDGKLYFIDDQDLVCVSAADGAQQWRQRVGNWFHPVSLGPDYLTGRGYSGHAVRYDLVDGKPTLPKGRAVLLGGPDHACGPALLTAGGVSVAVTVSGLYLRDVRNGEILWSSPGFAPRACPSPCASNGRIFYNPQCDAMIYCFEPDRTPPPATQAGPAGGPGGTTSPSP